MDNFDSVNSVNYQTIPPTTVMMAGNSKEDSPMRVDDDMLSSNSNAGGPLVPDDDLKLPNTPREGNNVSYNSLSQPRGESAAFQDSDATPGGTGTNPLPDKRPGSNVIVDESPLQLQMEKNKECKLIVEALHFLYLLYL